jgi:pyridoxamine 5'-phosphate oxidase
MCSPRQVFAQITSRVKDAGVTSSTSDRYAPDLMRMRREYSDSELTEDAIAADWPTQFGRWLAEAIASEVPEPNAMVLSTADASGRPSARSVLLKRYDEGGFVFFTNYESRKGGELSANPYASLVFPWYAIHRQVLVIGRVERTSRAETEEYFAVRPRGAQLGAWASAQSRPVESRVALEHAWQAVERRFPDDVPAPGHWGGFRVVPTSVEFWQGRRSRLHDRLRFTLVEADAAGSDAAGSGADGEAGAAGAAGGEWRLERLSP